VQLVCHVSARSSDRSADSCRPYCAPVRANSVRRRIDLLSCSPRARPWIGLVLFRYCVNFPHQTVKIQASARLRREIFLRLNKYLDGTLIAAQPAFRDSHSAERCL
jgi:hypothetical protein